MDPLLVDPSWRAYFDQLDRNPVTHGHAANGTAARNRHAHAEPAPVDDAVEVQDHVARLVGAYRSRGHRFAKLDVLGLARENWPRLAAFFKAKFRWA